MATAGLFSMLGGDEAAMQRQLDEQRAQAFAQQTQEQRLAGMGYKAGAGLGRGLAGAFGVDVTDPTIRQAAELRRMASEYDVSSPEGLMQMAQALRGSNPQMAVQLAEKAQAMRKTMAETQAKTSEKLTPEQKNAEALADASGAARGTPEWAQAYKSSLTGLTAKAPSIDTVGVATTSRNPVYFDRATNEQFIVQDGKRVAYTGGIDRTTSNVSLSPEIKMTNQELDWRKQFLSENKPVVDQGANVRQSLNLLSQSNSPFAQAAFNNTVVSAFGGDKQKSNAEIKRLANTGALDTRIANTLTNFFEGKNTATTVQDQQDVLNAVDKALAARYASSSKGWETRLKQAKVDPSMVVPSYEEVVGTKSAGGQTVNYQGAPATIVSQNADGTVVIEQNGVRKILAPKK